MGRTRLLLSFRPLLPLLFLSPTGPLDLLLPQVSVSVYLLVGPVVASSLTIKSSRSPANSLPLILRLISK